MLEKFIQGLEMKEASKEAVRNFFRVTVPMLASNTDAGNVFRTPAEIAAR